MSLTIVIACRRSPARLAGATTPIGTLTVAPAAELRLWDQDARTLRFLRELAGVVTIESVSRWGDFAFEYAALVAQAFDGIVAVAGEILGDVEQDRAPLDRPRCERDLAFAWRAVDDRAHAALDDYDRAMRVKHLTWEAAAASDSSPIPAISRRLD